MAAQQKEVLIRIQDRCKDFEVVLSKKGERRIFPICMLICAAISVMVLVFFNNGSTLNTFCYSPKRREELWRLVTYTFLHASPVHLAFNMVMLLTFGLTFEIEHGHWKASLIYLTGGIMGALGCDVFDRRRRVIGSSASCSSLLMAHMAHIIINWRSLNRKYQRLMIAGSFIASDIVSWPLSSYCSQTMNLAWSSHFAAEVNGLLLGTLILSKNTPDFCWLKCSISALYAVLLVLAIIIYDPYISEMIYLHAIRYDLPKRYISLH